MNPLHLLLLGTPELWLGNEQIILPTRKTLALLVYLALAGNRQSRERLMVLFWPESDEKRSRGALRTTLTYLRRALPTSVAANLLHSSGDQIELDMTHLIVDAQQLAEAVEKRDATQLTAVLTHHRGSFLEGFTLADAPSFEEWATVQREQLQRQLAQLFDQLSQQQLAARQFAEATTTAVRWRSSNPLDEAAHRRLIESYLLAGNQTAARQAYEQCRAVLAAELGVAPAPATQAMIKRLRVDAPQPPPQPGATPNNRPIGSVFVGRIAEHSKLVAWWQMGQTQIVTIQGEPGIGKTRLVAEFLRWVAVQGGDIVQGRAFEAGGRLPYQPLIDGLRQRLEQENAPEDLLSDVWLAALSRLLPELRDRYPDLPATTADERLAVTELLEAIARLGQSLAQKGGGKTAVWFIDDLQWADAATLDALFYCARSWATSQTPLLLLFTIRSDALALDASLAAWLAQLHREVTMTHLGLGPLSAGETSELIARWQMIPTDLTALGDWLYRETGGHPFYLSETLQAWREEGNAAWIATQTRLVAIPNVRQLVLSRVRQLSLAGRGLLTAVSVLGRPASFAQLCQVARLDDETALLGLDELLARGLLAETNHLAYPYSFTHDHVRDIVYDEAGAARRRVFHHRAYTALLVETPPAAELAHHALAAGLAEAALTHSAAAGAEAMAVFALRDAVYHYEQARTLLQTLATVEPLAQTIYSKLGRAYELLGDLAAAEAVCREFLALARQGNQPELVCEALNRLASLAIYSQRLETAVSHLHEVAALAEQHQLARALVEAEWNLAQLAQHHYQIASALHHSQRALTNARQLNDAELIARSLNSLGYAHLLRGAFAACGTTMQEAQTRYEALGNRALVADSLTGRAGALVFEGDHAQAIGLAQLAQAIYKEIENPWGLLFSGGWLAAALVDNGRLSEALSVCLAGSEHVQTLGTTPVSIWNRLWLGNSYRALHDVESAVAVHEAAARINEAAPLGAFGWYIAAELCADYWLLGRWEQAYEAAQMALQRCVYDAVPQIVLPQWAITAVLLHAGDNQQAYADLHQAEQLWATLPRFRVPYLRAQAVAAEWAEQTAQAVAYLQEALALAQQLRLPNEQEAIAASLRSVDICHSNEASRRTVE